MDLTYHELAFIGIWVGCILISLSIFLYLCVCIWKNRMALGEEFKQRIKLYARRFLAYWDWIPVIFICGFICLMSSGVILLWLNAKQNISQHSSIDGRLAQIHNVLKKQLPGKVVTEMHIKELVEIRDVLNDKLPDHDTQARRHQELIDAIRSITSLPFPALVPSVEKSILKPSLKSPKGTEWVVLIAGGFLLAAGVMFLIACRGKLGITLFVGTLCTLGGLSLFSVSTLNLITLNVENPFSRPVIPLLQFQIEKERIGFFPTGEDKILDKGGKVKDSVMGIINNISEKIEDRLKSHKTFILLIGCADKRPLVGRDLIKRYGSNAGLAQARANWVKSLISDRVSSKLSPSNSMVLHSGPREIGEQKSEEDMIKDRIVEIYIFGTKTQFK